MGVCVFRVFKSGIFFIYVQNKLPKNIFFSFYSNLLHHFFDFPVAICPLFDYFKHALFRVFCGKSFFVFFSRGDIHRYLYSPISTFMLLSSIVCVFLCRVQNRVEVNAIWEKTYHLRFSWFYS